MADDGTVWINVLPSMRGFGAALVNGTGAATRQAANRLRSDMGDAGAEAGRASAEALQAAMLQIQTASGRVASAREAEVEVSRRVAQAEAEVAQARNAANSDAAAIAAAENDLAAARTAATAASARVTSATADLAQAQRMLASESQEVAKAQRNLQIARDKEADAAGKVAVAERKLAELQASGRASASQLLAAEERLRTSRRNLATASDRVAQATLDLDAAQERAASGAADSASAHDRQGDSLLTLGKNVAAAGAAFAGLGGAAALGMSALDQGQSIARLNASMFEFPGMAEENGRVAGELFSQAYGGSMDEVTAAMGAVSSTLVNLGVDTEAELSAASKHALNFADIFGTDVNESVMTVGQLITNGLAKDSTQAFDMMTTAFKNVPASMRDELPEILNEYGTHFRGLGFEGEEAFNVLVSAAQNGKWALDKTGDALKEFTLRGSDMSKTSVEAYESIGLSAQEMSDAIAAGGPAAQDALQKTARGLLEIEGPSDRANAAIALFGTPIEDLAVDQIPAFLETLGQAPDYMNGFAGSAEAAGNTLRDNAGTRLEEFKRSLTQTFIDVMGGQVIPKIEAFIGWIGENKQLLTDLAVAVGVVSVAYGVLKVQQAAMAAGGLLVWIRTMITTTGLWSIATGVLNTVMSANPFVRVGLLIAALIGFIVLAYRNSETFRAIVQAAWQGIQDAISFAWNSVIRPVWDALLVALGAMGAFFQSVYNEVIKPVWDAFAAVVTWVYENFIRPTFNNIGVVLGLLGQAFSMWWNGVVRPVWDAFTGAIGWIYDNVIRPTFDAITGALTSVGAAFSDWWNGTVKPTWDAFGLAIGYVVDTLFGPAIDRLKQALGVAKDFIKGAVDDITGFFSAMGRSIGGVWDSVISGVKSVVRTLGKLLQKVPTKIGPFEVPGGNAAKGLGDSLVNWAGAYANGGQIHGPGTGTSDSILAAVSDGEYIVNAKATAANLPLLQAINGGLGLPAFATGGLIDAQNFARGESGKPYQYGGVGNPSWDCSGYMSGIYATLTGKDQYTRHFTTESDFEALGFVPGLGGPNDFSIGVSRGGGGPNSHMAGTLGDLNVESGSNGVIAGAGAQGAADFPLTWHLPGLGDDPNASTSGASAFDFGDGGGMGSGGSGGSSGGSGGSYSGSGNVSSTGATAVFVVNWPSGSSDYTGAASAGATASLDTGASAGVEAAGGADAEVYTPGLWFTDPATAALDAVFEVLGISDLVKAGDFIQPQAEKQANYEAAVKSGSVERFGVGGTLAAAPVASAWGTPTAGEGVPVIGTQVNGDVHVTDLDEFNRSNEQGMREVATRMGL